MDTNSPAQVQRHDRMGQRHSALHSMNFSTGKLPPHAPMKPFLSLDGLFLVTGRVSKFATYKV